MNKNITFKGTPLVLAGRILTIGKTAPDFKAASQDLKEKSLADFKGRIKIINSFPSLDTPVCDLQVKEFNKRAAGLSADIVILGISKDLPFAQKRFCDNFDIKNVTILSDYRTSSFGISYGILIRELNLLARAAFIIDKNDVLRYVQIAPEITSTLDYEDILKNLEDIIRNPVLSIKEALPSKCKPCEGGTPPMPKETVDKLLAEYRGWELIDGKKLVKEFKFKDFVEAKYFIDLVAIIAEEQGHHPAITIIYNKVKITLTTHAAGGLTENDFIIAGIIDELAAEK